MKSLRALLREYLTPDNELDFMSNHAKWELVKQKANADEPDPHDLIIRYGKAVAERGTWEEIAASQRAFMDFYEKYKEVDLPSTIGKLPAGVKRVA